MKSKFLKYNADKVELWLFVSMLLVAAMIILGGATRLTNSGLSITEWAPIKGFCPLLITSLG